MQLGVLSRVLKAPSSSLRFILVSGRLELEWASSIPLKSQSIVWRGAWRSAMGQQEGPQAPECVDRAGLITT